MNKYKEWTFEFTEWAKSFLDGIFLHEKCKSFTLGEKVKIEKAYSIAISAHMGQKRAGDRPYIEHIERTVKRFLSITKWDVVDVSDIIVAILHDTIEDHPKYIHEIRTTFPLEIYQRVLALSKPSAEVVTQAYTSFVRSVMEKPQLYFRYGISAWANYFLSVFSRNILKTEGTEKQKKLFEHLILLGKKYQLETLRDYQNYQFFWMIAMLSEIDFEIKTSDRLDNLDDLQYVNTDYINKNLISTEIYMQKAATFSREDLVSLLAEWMAKLEKRKGELTKTVTSPASSPSS